LAKSGSGEGLTPWQLLRLARTAQDETDRQRYASIWWQIVNATKGKAQLYISEGWKLLVEEYRAEQEGEEQAEPETVMVFGVREKGSKATGPWVSAFPKRLAVREAAEAHDDLEQAALAAAEAIRAGPTDTELIDGDDDEEIELIE
ncbi:hypothetical protein, partial [Ralstonia pseudosolanacearum]|uniref:hypothetical protein n=1 Tax=Ralstonia pseudosolanacearum TaxID=1310165 RepID=UPI003CF57499